MSDELNLEPLEKACEQLTNGLEQIQSKPADELYRDGVIQRFEYTYELSWKMLKRYLETTSSNPEEVDKMSFNTLIRTGSEKGLLLNGLEKWELYRKSRGTTSHAYDKQKAEEVFNVIPDFLREAKYLLKQMKQPIT